MTNPPPPTGPPLPHGPAQYTPPPVAPTPLPSTSRIVAEKPPRKPRRAGWIVAVSLLTVALIAAGTLLYMTYEQLQDANTVIDEQDQIIEQKEDFTAAMSALVAKTAEFDGVKIGELVPQDRIQILADRAYKNRREPAEVASITAEVERLTAGLDEELVAAQAEAATNASGTPYEAVIDALGGGFATTAIDNADGLCAADVLGCVTSEDPLVVHIDAADVGLEYMTDFIKTGVSYHEFAHVLQWTNPEASATAAEAFGGDMEQMADCFALTYLDGWKLHHTVFVSDFEYYEVDIGYGYTCNDAQKQVIRDWYDGLGYTAETVSQR